jgi:hypothetical protein
MKRQMTIAIAILFALTSVATAAQMGSEKYLGGEIGYKTARTDVGNVVNLSSPDKKDYFEKAHGYVAPQ